MYGNGAPMKRCPHCGALVFADMDVCYECMNGLEPPAARSVNARGDIPSVKPHEPAGYSFGSMGDMCDVYRRDSEIRGNPAEMPGIRDNAAEAAGTQRDGSARKVDLFGLFLIEFSRFLQKFVADRVVGVQKPVRIVGKDAAMRSVSDQQIDA